MRTEGSPLPAVRRGTASPVRWVREASGRARPIGPWGKSAGGDGEPTNDRKKGNAEP